MIYFLIPVFNESLNIAELYKELQASIVEKERFYLFVDDYSTDDTVKSIQQHFSDSNHFVIQKQKNKGPGDSFNLGFEWILKNAKNASDIIITIEGDNTADLSILQKMIAISDLGYDLVLPSVYSQGGNLEKTSFFRKVLSFFANLILRFLLNIKVLTLSSFYRLYKVSLILKIKENHKIIIEENGFLSMVEVLIKAIRVNATIIEVPTRLLSHKREGKSKMKIGKTFLEYLKLIIRMSGNRKHQKILTSLETNEI